MRNSNLKYTLVFLLFVVSTLTLFAEHIIFFEDFDASPTIPAGWATDQLEPSRPAEKAWVFNNPYPRTLKGNFSGNFAIFDGALFGGYIYQPPYTKAQLTTPKIDCSGYSDVTLSFDSRYSFGSSYRNTSLQISSDGSTWNTIEEYGSTSHNETLKTYDISAYAVGEKEVQIRWYIELSGYFWAIDNVKLTSTEPPTLPVELSSFTVNQFVNDGVLLKWTSESETNLFGYNIYRSEDVSLENAIKINDAIIPGTNTSFRTNYAFEDDSIEIDAIYFYWLESVNLVLTNEFHGPISILVKDMTEGGGSYIKPLKTRLIGAYPNPFNPSTKIFFSLDKGRNVTIDIYNAQGQLIQSLCTDRYFEKGDNSLAWIGTNLSSGVYYISLKAGTETMQKKMLLLK